MVVTKNMDKLVKNIFLISLVLTGAIFIKEIFKNQPYRLEFNLTDKKIDLSKFNKATNNDFIDSPVFNGAKEKPPENKIEKQEISPKLDKKIEPIRQKTVSSLIKVADSQLSKKQIILSYLKDNKPTILVDRNFFETIIEKIKNGDEEYFKRLEQLFEREVTRLNNSHPPDDLREFVNLRTQFYKQLHNFITLIRKNKIKNLDELKLTIEFKRLAEITNQLKLLSEKLLDFLK